MVDAKKFLHHLRSSSLDWQTQQGVIDLLPQLSTVQIEEIYKTLIKDNNAQKKILAKAQTKSRSGALKTLRKFTKMADKNPEKWMEKSVL